MPEPASAPTPRPSRRLLLGGMAAAAVSAARLPAAAAQSLGAAPPSTSTPAGSTAAAAGAGLGAPVETRVAPPVDGEPGVVGETGLDAFGLIGVSAPDLAGDSSAQLRVLGDGGWEPWTPLVTSHAPDVSDPVWVGHATGYEVQGLPDGSAVSVHLVRDRSTLPRRSPEQLHAQSAPKLHAITPDPTPPIILRDAWGARPPVEVEYWPTIRLGIIHHSVTSNSYAPGDVPAILRSIQAYHMDINGWWDIAYQFLIDDYGNMWEGRAGGIDESFFGAHSLGFNADTFGVCNIGDFSQANPTNAMLSSIAELTAWKLKRYDLDAAGLTTVECTEDNEWFKDGQIVTFPAIVGHSDTRPDECPGHLLEAWLPWIRNEAHNRQGKYKVKPPPAVASEGPLCRNADGRLEVFAVGGDGELHHIWQDPASPSAWSALASLGGAFTPGPVSVIANADGRLEVFLVGTDGVTYHNWQSPGSGNGWSGFWNLSSRHGSAPAVARNFDGRLEMLGIDDTGALWRTAQVAPNSGWSDPVVVGTGLTGSPNLGAGLDGRLTVWAVTTGGALAGAYQTSAGDGWGAVVTLPSSVTGRPVVGRNDDGRMEVFVLGTDHRIYHSWQSGYFMSSVVALGDATFSLPPTVGRNADGRLEVFGVGTDGHLWHTYQVAPNSGWSAITPMNTHVFSGPPSVTANADGRLEVFLTGPGGVPWHGWQVAPNSWWSDFYPLY